MTFIRRKASRSQIRNQWFIGTPVRAFAARIHATGCSLREIEKILRLFSVERSHRAIFQWVRRVVDDHSDRLRRSRSGHCRRGCCPISGMCSWLYAAIDR